MNRRRKKRNILPGLIAAALLALALWLLLDNVVFVVREVQIVGAGSVPEADVRRLSGISLGTRMRALDEPGIHLDVESDGRIAFVSIEKHLPSRVVLNVRPRTKDVVILQGGHILVLDSDAYLIEVADRLPTEQFVYVTGIANSNTPLGRQLDTADGRCAAMKAVVEALKAQGAKAYVSELSVQNINDIRIITRTGMTVLLGNSGDMTNKIAWMAAALADLEARGETDGLLDVSSGNKADYRPGDRSAEGAQSAEDPSAEEAAGS